MDAAQRQARAEGHERLQHAGHVQRELHRVEEGPVDGRGVADAAPGEVDDPAHRRVARQDAVQAHDGRGQGVDHVAQRLHGLRHLLRDGQQEVQHRGLQVQPDVLQRDLRVGHAGVAQAPVPVQHEVAFEAGQALDAQRQAQVQVRADAEVHLERVQRVGQYAVERDAAGLVALQVDGQAADEAAALEAWGRAGVVVLDAGLEEQQLAAALEGRDHAGVLRVPVEVGAHVQRELGVLAVGVGGQEEAAAGRQAEAEVELPVGVQREAAVHVQAEARQIEVQRNVDARGQDGAAELHVEADGVGIAGQGLPQRPGREAVVGRVVEGDVDVVQREAGHAVEVLQDAQAAEGVEQGLADERHRLPRAGELDAQILQQAAAQLAQQRAGVGEVGADEGDVGREAALEQVLHRAQAQVHAVEHEARVVEHVQQRVVARRHRLAEVGQFHLERRGARGLPGQLGQEGRQTLAAQRRVGVDVQLAQRQLPPERRQPERQVDVQRALRAELQRSVFERDAQQRRRGRVGLRVGVQHHRAAGHAELHRTAAEHQRQVAGAQAGREVQVRAGAALRVEVHDLERRRARGRARQGEGHARYQPRADAELARRAARDVEQLGEVRRQLQAAAGQRHQRGQVQVDAEVAAVRQRHRQVHVEAVVRRVQREAEQVGRQAQGLLDRGLHLGQRGGRRGAGLLDARQQRVAELQDVGQRAVQQRQPLGVEGLARHRVVHHVGHQAQPADDVGEIQAAEVHQRRHVGQHGHHVMRRQAQRLALRRVVDVEGVRANDLDAGPVEEVLHVQRQLLAGADVEAGVAALDLQALEPRVGLALDVEDQAGQPLAGQLRQREALAAAGAGRAVQRRGDARAQVHPGARARAAGHQADEAQLRRHGEVLHVGRQPGAGHEVVDRQVEAFAAQRQHEVEAHAHVHAQLGLRGGGQRQAGAGPQVQVQRRREHRHAHLGADGDHEVARGGVEACLPAAQHARAVERVDELAHRADALDLLVHRVGRRRVGGGEGVGQLQRAAVGGHRDHLQHLAARRHPVALHRGRELAGLARQRGAALGGGGRAGGLLGLAGRGRPRLQRPVEVDLVDHAALERAGQVQHLLERALDEGQLAQAERGDVHRLQVVQHRRQRQQQVLDLDAREVGQPVQALGLELQRPRQRVAADGDARRPLGAAGHVHAREHGIDRQRHRQRVVAGLDLEDAVVQRQRAAQVQAQRALLPGLAGLVEAELADAHVQRPQPRREHQVLRRQAALEAQAVEVEGGGQAVLPVELEREVHVGLQLRLQLDLRIDLQPVAGQRGPQVDGDLVGAQLEAAVEGQGQAVLVEREAQPGADAGLRRPVGVQVGLEPGQRGHAPRAVARRRQARQAGGPGRVDVAVEVLLDVVADAHQRRQVEDVVQRQAQQRQRLAVLQRRARLAELAGHVQQRAAQAAAQRHVQVGQAEAQGVGTGGEVHHQRAPADGDRLVHRLAAAVERQRHVAEQRHARQSGHRQRGRARERQGEALPRQHQRQRAVDDARALAVHLHGGLQPARAQHGAAVDDAHRDAARALQPGLGRGVGGVLQLEAQGAGRLQHGAVEVQPRDGRAAQPHGGAVEAAVAVEVALGEVHHAAGQRAAGRAGVDGHAQRAALQHQARHAFQARAGRRGAQADEGAATGGVAQHHQADVGVAQHHAGKGVAADAAAQLQADVACRQRRDVHQALAAVVQRGAARTQPRQAEGALQQHRAADADGGVGDQRHECAAGTGEVQGQGFGRAVGDLAGAHAQRMVHRHAALGHHAQLQHVAQRQRADAAEDLVDLQVQRAGLDQQVGPLQAEVGRVERELVGLRLERQPGAAVVRRGIGRAQQRQGQVEPGHLDAADARRQVARADDEARGAQRAAAGHDVELLARHRHGAAGLQLVADLDEHRAADLHAFAAEVQRRRHRLAVADLQPAAAAPVQGVGIAQAQVQRQVGVRAGERHAVGGRAQHGHRVGVALQRDPAAAVARGAGLGQHQAEVQPAELEADGRGVAAAGHARRHVRAAEREHAGGDAGAAGERERARGQLEADRAAERQQAAHLRLDRAAGPQQRAQGAVEVQHRLAVRAGAHLDRARLEVDDVLVGTQAGRQVVDGVELQVQARGREGDLGQAHQRHGAGLGRQRHPARALERAAGGVLRAVAGAEERQREVHVAQRQAQGIGVGRVPAVDAAVAVAVHAVRAADAEEGLHVGRAHGQLVHRDGAAVGQLDAGAVLVEGEGAADEHRVRQLQAHVGRQAQHLVLGARQRHGLRAARAGGHGQRRAGEVQHAPAAGVGQVDGDAGVAHLGRELGHAHQARRAGLRLQGHARGPRRAAGAAALGGDHQREIDIGQREADRVRARGVVGVDAAVAVAVHQRAAMQAGEGLQVRAAQRQHVMAGDAAVLQRQCAHRLLEAQRAADVEEVAHRERDVARGAQQRAAVARDVEHAARTGAGRHRQRRAAQVQHQRGGVRARRQAADLADDHLQVAHLDLHRGYADEAHAAGAGLQRQPVQAVVAGGLARVGAQQRQRELAVRHLESHRRGVGRVLSVDAAVAVAVHPVRAAHAGEQVQARAAEAQAVRQQLAAVGQGHGGGGLLHRQRAAGVDEAGHRQLEIARGADRLALLAVQRQRELRALAGGHVEGLRPQVQHLRARVRAGRDALHEVDAHVQTLRGGGEAVHAHQRRFVGRGLQRQPVALAGLVPGQQQAELGVGDRQAQGLRVGSVLQVDDAVAVGVAAVRAAHADEGVEPGAADGQHARVHHLAVGQGEGHLRLLQRQRAAGVQEAGHRQVHAAGGAHELAAGPVVRERQRAAGAGGDGQRVVHGRAVRVLARSEVDDLRRRLGVGEAVREVDVDAQRVDVEAQVLGQAHQGVDAADAAGQRRPALAGIGALVRVGREQRQAELDAVDGQAARLGVDLVALDHAVVVEVDAVGAAADEGVQPGAADAQELGIDHAAVGQGDRLRAALEAQRAADLEEVAHAQLDVAGGAHELAQPAVEVQRHRVVRAGHDVERARAAAAREVDDPRVGVHGRGRARDQVELDLDVAGRDREVGHAHHLHAAGRGLERGPVQAVQPRLAGARREQREGEVHAAERQAHRVRIDAVVGVDDAVAVAVALVGTAHAGEGVQVPAAEGQHVGLRLRAVGQHHVLRGALEAQRAAGVDEVRHLQLEVARGAHQRAPARVVAQRDGLGARLHLQRRAAVVDDVLAGAAGVDVDGQALCLQRDQRQADLGGRGRRGADAEPAARRGRALPAAAFQVHRQAHVHARELEARGSGVGHLVAEVAVVVDVQPVGAVEADEGLQARAADHPAPGLRGAAVGELDRGLGVAQHEAAVQRQEVRRLQRHADRVGAVHAEVVGVEEQAQRVGIGLRVGVDVHQLGQRALHRVERQGVRVLRHLQQHAAVAEAEQAGGLGEAAGDAAGLDEAEVLQPLRREACGAQHVQRGAGVQAQRAGDLQAVARAGTGQRQRQALVGGDVLVALDAQQARGLAAAEGAGRRRTGGIDQAQALRGAHHHVAGREQPHRVELVHRGRGRQRQRAGAGGHVAMQHQPRGGAQGGQAHRADAVRRDRGAVVQREVARCGAAAGLQHDVAVAQARHPGQGRRGGRGGAAGARQAQLDAADGQRIGLGQEQAGGAFGRQHAGGDLQRARAAVADARGRLQQHAARPHVGVRRVGGVAVQDRAAARHQRHRGAAGTDVGHRDRAGRDDAHRTAAFRALGGHLNAGAQHHGPGAGDQLHRAVRVEDGRCVQADARAHQARSLRGQRLEAGPGHQGHRAAVGAQRRHRGAVARRVQAALGGQQHVAAADDADARRGHVQAGLRGQQQRATLHPGLQRDAARVVARQGQAAGRIERGAAHLQRVVGGAHAAAQREQLQRGHHQVRRLALGAAQDAAGERFQTCAGRTTAQADHQVVQAQVACQLAQRQAAAHMAAHGAAVLQVDEEGRGRTARAHVQHRVEFQPQRLDSAATGGRELQRGGQHHGAGLHHGLQQQRAVLAAGVDLDTAAIALGAHRTEDREAGAQAAQTDVAVLAGAAGRDPVHRQRVGREVVQPDPAAGRGLQAGRGDRQAAHGLRAGFAQRLGGDVAADLQHQAGGRQHRVLRLRVQPRRGQAAQVAAHAQRRRAGGAHGAAQVEVALDAHVQRRAAQVQGHGGAVLAHVHHQVAAHVQRQRQADGQRARDPQRAADLQRQRLQRGRERPQLRVPGDDQRGRARGRQQRQVGVVDGHRAGSRHGGRAGLRARAARTAEAARHGVDHAAGHQGHFAHRAGERQQRAAVGQLDGLAGLQRQVLAVGHRQRGLAAQRAAAAHRDAAGLRPQLAQRQAARGEPAVAVRDHQVARAGAGLQVVGRHVQGVDGAPGAQRQAAGHDGRLGAEAGGLADRAAGGQVHGAGAAGARNRAPGQAAQPQAGLQPADDQFPARGQRDAAAVRGDGGRRGLAKVASGADLDRAARERAQVAAEQDVARGGIQRAQVQAASTGGDGNAAVQRRGGADVEHAGERAQPHAAVRPGAQPGALAVEEQPVHRQAVGTGPAQRRRRQRADHEAVLLQQPDVAAGGARQQQVDEGAQPRRVGRAADAGGRGQRHRGARQVEVGAVRRQCAADGAGTGDDGDHRAAGAVAQRARPGRIGLAGVHLAQDHALAAAEGLQPHVAAAREGARRRGHGQVAGAGLQQQVAAAAVHDAAGLQDQRAAGLQAQRGTAGADAHARGHAQRGAVGQGRQQQQAAGVHLALQRQPAGGHLQDRGSRGLQAGQAQGLLRDRAAQGRVAPGRRADGAEAVEGARHGANGHCPAGLQRHVAAGAQRQAVRADLQRLLAAAELAHRAGGVDQQVAGDDVVARVLAGLHHAAAACHQGHGAGPGIQPVQRDRAGRDAHAALGLRGALAPAHLDARAHGLHEAGAGLDVEAAAVVAQLRARRLAHAAARQQVERALAHVDVGVQAQVARARFQAQLAGRVGGDGDVARHHQVARGVDQHLRLAVQVQRLQHQRVHVMDGDDGAQRGVGRGLQRVGVDLQRRQQRAQVAHATKLARLARDQAHVGARDVDHAAVLDAVGGQHAAAVRAQRDVAAQRGHLRQHQAAAGLGQVDVAGRAHRQRGHAPAVVAGQLLAVLAQVHQQRARVAAHHAAGAALRALGHQHHVAVAAQQRHPGRAAALRQDRAAAFQPHAAAGGDAAEQQVLLVAHAQVALAAQHHLAGAADRHHAAGVDVEVVPDLQRDAEHLVAVLHPLALAHHLHAVGRRQQRQVRRQRLGGVHQAPAAGGVAAFAGEVEGRVLTHPLVALVLHRQDVARAGRGQHGAHVGALLVQVRRVDDRGALGRAADATGRGLRHQRDVAALHVEPLLAAGGRARGQLQVREDGLHHVRRDRVLRTRQQRCGVGQARLAQLGLGEAGLAQLLQHRGRVGHGALVGVVQDHAVARLQPHVAIAGGVDRHRVVLPRVGRDQAHVARRLLQVDGAGRARGQAAHAQHRAVHAGEDRALAAVELHLGAEDARAVGHALDAVERVDEHVARAHHAAVLGEGGGHHLAELEHVLRAALGLQHRDVAGGLHVQAPARVLHRDRDVAVGADVGQRADELDVARHFQRVRRQRDGLEGLGLVVGGLR